MINKLGNLQTMESFTLIYILYLKFKAITKKTIINNKNLVKLTGSSGLVRAQVKTVDIQINTFIELKLSISPFKAMNK